MKLYLIKAHMREWETFESAVVAAETESEAKMTHPGNGLPITCDENTAGSHRNWPIDPKDVSVEYLGEAKLGTKAGVICTSYNAG